MKRIIYFLTLSMYVYCINAQTLNNDSSITFSYNAPQAKQVYLESSIFPKIKNHEFTNGILAQIANQSEKGRQLSQLFNSFGKDSIAEMKKDVKGIWTFVSKPVKPELYTYRFIVDDSIMLDSSNKQILRNVNELYNYFVIPGSVSSYYITRNIPHGRIEKIWYSSKIGDGKPRRVSIYTPAGYNAKSSTRYPVLYLLHGSGGDEDSWIECGQVYQILDNLIYEGKAEPMIVVMPNDIPEMHAAPGVYEGDKKKSSGFSIASMTSGAIEYYFPLELIPFIEKNYKTRNNKSGKAIAGYSLGGLHSIFISANNPELFDYVGLFSAQNTNTIDRTSKNQFALLGKIAQKANAISNNATKWINQHIGDGIVDDTRILNTYGTEHIAIYKNIDSKLKEQFKNPPALYFIRYGYEDFVFKLNQDFKTKLDEGGYKYDCKITEGGHTWRNWRHYFFEYVKRIFK